ncbi:MAG TPA: energy-coupling factor transporter ATPase [Bacillota bacterium]|nr:energy-coupling factor transporter ATPase [Bacillota bacterium]HOH10978.1 energy-coupling factor transporter ATPase [Bacillota bacterium]HOS50278.1 energy-coupling factor transporter ATPase [Bacillota bacterium]HOY89069.1 energy-coupling factor transporter ATPase [Bacillota bacterium]HPI02056.1 energy-coupling factor transporter ATPase [Bacillota bacterium]
MEPVIRIRGLKYTYDEGSPDEVEALSGVDMDIFPGQFVSVIGRNGSGKSTLAKAMNAIVVPDEGVVIVNGIQTSDENRLWDIRRVVGMVFQNPDNQLVATTVEEDIAFGPENLGVPSKEIAERVEEALRLTGMEGFKDFPPHMLSGGQKQRVAIAGVIAMRPRCIVLDESTAMLDPLGRREVLEAAYRLAREEGIAIVLITHFMEEAMLADSVYIMDAGKFVAQGDPSEIFYKVDDLKGLGLDEPQVVELSKMLKHEGLDIAEGVLSAEEMADRLSALIGPGPREGIGGTL